MHAYIEDISKHQGQEVTLKGWLHNRRSSGKIHFLILRDGTGFIQAVISKAAVGDEMFKTADHLSQETSVIVTGTARADARAPGGYEIDVRALEVIGRLEHVLADRGLRHDSLDEAGTIAQNQKVDLPARSAVV